MACNCTPTIISPTVKSCDSCLKLVSLRYLCMDGPAPCGDTLIEDLSTHNDVTACDCGTAVYSIVSFDTEAFSDVVITSNGVMTATTTSNFTDMKEYKIVYKVDCPCNILSGTGNIYACMENLCAGVSCEDTEYCDQCDGLCKESESDLDISGGAVGTGGSEGTGFVI